MKVMFIKDDLVLLQNYLTGLRSRYKNAFQVRDDSAQLDSGEQLALTKLSQYYREKGGTEIPRDEFYLFELRETAYRELDNWLTKVHEDIQSIEDETHAELFDRTILSTMTGQQLQDILLDTLEKAKRKGLI